MGWWGRDRDRRPRHAVHAGGRAGRRRRHPDRDDGPERDHGCAGNAARPRTTEPDEPGSSLPDDTVPDDTVPGDAPADRSAENAPR